jgi:hypothetical protein
MASNFSIRICRCHSQGRWSNFTLSDDVEFSIIVEEEPKIQQNLVEAKKEIIAEDEPPTK